MRARFAGSAGIVMSAAPNLANAVLFQGAWFACVLGGAAGTSAWGAVAVAGLLAFAAVRDRLGSDLVYAAVGALTGFALDTLWIHAGVLDYAGATVAPAWIVLLWAGVGLTLNHSMAPFALRPWLGAGLAGASAPLSYLGGERLGAVVVPEPALLIVVAIAWMVLFGVAFRIARGTCVRGGGMTHSPA